MKIPKRFQLLGRTIEVEIIGEPFIESDGTYGFACYRQDKIQLRPDSKSLPISKERMFHTFCHELIHFITYFSGAAYTNKDEGMYLDEDFIDLTGGLLAQALSTAEYEG